MIWNLENTYSSLPKELFSKVDLNPVEKPELVAFNSALARELGLGEFQPNTDLLYLAGNSAPPSSQPLAQAYSGHQFGHYNTLGDGRALLLGEFLTPKKNRYDLQLKGSGPTPYSRRGDGRAALGPMLREYLISEAMFALGIPTTRSLAVATTGEQIYRETILPGAVLTRIASSHIRVGTFQLAAFLSSNDSLSPLRELTEYTISRHYPEIADSSNPPLELLKIAIRKQAELISQWMGVGFIHGVMNTDNMTLSGETIDYGPCAFMNRTNLETVFSSIDRNGRYSFGNQPGIAQWNLARLAESLLPLIEETLAVEAIQEFKTLYESFWNQKLVSKLGLEIENLSLAKRFFDLLCLHQADFTNSFRDLSLPQLPKNSFTETQDFQSWHKEWIKAHPNKKSMETVNPAYIPRNHLVEQALAAAQDQKDLALFNKLLNAVSKPFEINPNFTELTAAPSSEEDGAYKTFCGT